MAIIWSFIPPPFSLAVLSFPTYAVYHTLNFIHHSLPSTPRPGLLVEAFKASIKSFVQTTSDGAILLVMGVEWFMLHRLFFYVDNSENNTTPRSFRFMGVCYVLFAIYRISTFGKQYPDSVKLLHSLSRRWKEKMSGWFRKPNVEASIRLKDEQKESPPGP